MLTPRPAARRSTSPFSSSTTVDWASLTPEEIIATTGGSEAILFAFLACCDEGDEVLVVEPFYTNYSAFATMAGVRLVALGSRVEDGFHLPGRDAWERA